MKSSLLAFKYKSLKLESQYTEKGIVRLGWQCRKYIKWSEVHVGEDRDLLKEFGDSAVEDKKILSDMLPRVNEILLNVQRWRLDKEEWSVEPEHEKSWDRAHELILASAAEPRIIVSYLSERFGNIDQFSDVHLHKCLLKLLVFELALSSLRIKDFAVTIEDVIGSIDSFLLKLEDRDDLSKETSILFGSDDISEVCNLLDLPSLKEVRDLDRIISDVATSLYEVNVLDAKLPQSKLFKIEEIGGVRTIYLNSNNKFIMQLNHDDTKKQFFSRFMLSYIKTIADNPTLSKQLEDFNSYLAMNLNREFSKNFEG